MLVMSLIVHKLPYFRSCLPEVYGFFSFFLCCRPGFPVLIFLKNNPFFPVKRLNFFPQLGIRKTLLLLSNFLLITALLKAHWQTMAVN